MAAAQRTRVLLLIPHLGGGGAERVTALLAQGLSREKYEIHLAAVTHSGSESRPNLPEVQFHGLGAKRVRGGAWQVLKLVRLLKPRMILSGMAHLNFLVLLLRPLFPRGTHVLVRQNAMASAALEFGSLPAYTRWLYRRLYPLADRVICQTEAMARDLNEGLGVPAARIAVLPNPVDIEGIRALVTGAKRSGPSAYAGEGPHLLAIGRLSREKGFDLLIEAVAAARLTFPGIDLTIAGAGSEEQKLRGKCSELGLDSVVRFMGYVSDTAALFAEASAFVLSSRHEGLPNVLLEAASAGLPIVALPSSEGVAELLRGQPGVCLADGVSAEALERSLIAALTDLKPGQQFVHSFVEAFGMERAIAAYEALIDEVLREDTR